jgi:hypothetical protein
MAYMALDLRDPIAVTATTARHDGNCYPKYSEIVYEFGEYNGRPPLKMFWYDGGKRPTAEILEGCPKFKDSNGNEKSFDSGALVIGEKGKFYSPGDYGGEVQYTGIVVDGEFTNQRNVDMKVEYPRSPGHFTEFTNAIRGEGTTMSNFGGYAGPLTETVLLGNLAVWTGGKIQWDAKKMEASDKSESVAKMIRHEYHNGYHI